VLSCVRVGLGRRHCLHLSNGYSLRVIRREKEKERERAMERECMCVPVI